MFLFLEKKNREVIKIRNKKIYLLVIAMLIYMFIILNFTDSFAQYVLQQEICVANLNIDRTKPQIELISIQNSDAEYKNYANKNHNIIAKIKIQDKNLKEIFVDENHFKIKINGNYINEANMKFGQVQDKVDYKTVDIQLSNLTVDGKLKLVFTEGFAVDNGGLNSEKIEIETDIVVDNSIPSINREENEFTIDSFSNVDGTVSFD